ncbi:DUF4279 domain-containing protein [Chryseobacterium tructae]|uniref:DUF4279 domain-containing protein n=1 Tax=Chryseobacterium tructae TaxID=1037380 RepID=A0ABV7XWZ9_9FLAO|nr:DUF4279 domain-containing protein [Chryseobacterium tructae]MDN3692861.1 DUF4279 domain-containing protein [Chryseobacterium tructae]
MTEQEITNIIQNELSYKEWGITEQILEIHSPVYQDGNIVIENIVDDQNEKAVYIPIVDELFYLTFYIHSKNKEIIGISTEPKISIYFKAISEDLSNTELNEMTHLAISKSWNKGDQRKRNIGSYDFSCIMIELNDKPDTFERKLNNLLFELLKDLDGIRKLSEMAETTIQVVGYFHNGNGMIGGASLSDINIKKLADLNLSIDFDFYVSGNPYIS